MRIISTTAMLLFALLAAGMPRALSAQATAPAFNVSSDSAPGWAPTKALEQEALAAMNTFFAALENARYRDAYALMAPLNQQAVPYKEFSSQKVYFRDAAGPLIARRLLRITWSKDPPAAPVPGIYVTIDLSERYTKVSHQCGYVVMYQAPAGGPFLVMRTENNFIRDSELEKMPAEERDPFWMAQAQKYCPNYKPEPTIAVR